MSDSSETDVSLNLARVLRALPPAERVVLLLKHTQGLKIRTLAEIFNCPPEFIVEVLRKGTQRLRAQVGPALRQID
jgi:DNA-directed RNA polymerase specialized sigma24 family protein